MAHDVFISYSTKDKTIADAVCAKLEENKIRVWIAPRDVPAGSNFGASIIKAINTCKVFVLIWSAHTNVSEHIMNEVNQAFDQGITIIPFRIQDIQPTDEMRYYFGRTHWLDAINPPLENHINVLKNTILTNLGREIPITIPDKQPEKAPEIATLEKAPVVEKVEAANPPVLPGQQTSAQIKDEDNQPRKAAPGRLTRYIPYAAGGLAMIALAVLGISGVFKGPRPTETAQALPPLTKTIAPTKTSHPTPTATPIPAWVVEANALAYPVLAAIAYQPSDFADDFSNVDPGWYADADPRYCSDLDQGKLSITEGVMKYGIGPDCHFRQILHPELKYSNFVMQLDIDLEQIDSLYWSVYLWPVSSPQSEPFQAFGFYLSKNEWRTEIWDSTTENGHDVMKGSVDRDDQKPITLTIIKKGSTYLYYSNSILVTSLVNETKYDGPFEIRFDAENWSNDLPEIDTITLDNIKVWNLDTLFIPERILTAIVNQTPNFADDFSQGDSAWKFSPEEPGENMGCYNLDDAKIDISDGSLKYGIINCRVGNLSYEGMRYTNYVLQLDVNFQNNPLGLEFRNWSQSPLEDGGMLDFVIFGSGENGIFQVMKHTIVIDKLEYNKKIDFSKPVTVTVINKNPHFLVYANSTLLVSYHTQAYTGPFVLDFTVNQWNFTPTRLLTLELDNVKIWDLDEIEY